MASLKDILASLQGGLTKVTYGDAPLANDQPSAQDLAGANIDLNNTQDRGVFGALARFAKMRGTTRLQQLGAAKDEQGRQLALESQRLKNAESDKNMQYLDSLIQQHGFERTKEEAKGSQDAFKFAETQPGVYAKSNPGGDSEPHKQTFDFNLVNDDGSPKFNKSIDVSTPAPEFAPIRRDLPQKMEVKFPGQDSIFASPRSKQEVDAEIRLKTREAGEDKLATTPLPVRPGEKVQLGGKPGETISGGPKMKPVDLEDPTDASKPIKALEVDSGDGNLKYYDMKGNAIENPRKYVTPFIISTPISDPSSGEVTGALQNDRRGGAPKISPLAPPKGNAPGGPDNPIPPRVGVASAGERMGLQNFNNIKTIADEIQKYSSDVHKYGPLTAPVAGFKQRVESKLGLNPSVAQLTSLKGTLGQMARAIGSERGVLTDPDIARAASLVPVDPGITQGEAVQKMNEIYLLIYKARENYARSMGIDARDPRVRKMFGF